MTLHRSNYSYPPISARSPRGRARLSVHPCPEHAWWEFFRDTRYAYQLFATEYGYRGSPESGSAGYRSSDASERLSWKSERRSACPWAGFVHDDGTCAVLHADDELVFFDKDGATTAQCNVLSILRQDPSFSPYLKRSTAGVFWTDIPVGFFIETNQGLFLSLRLAQRARLCFNPANGVRVSLAEASPELPDAERSLLLDLLQDALDQGNFPLAGMLALFAGQDGITEAIPPLLALEARASEPTIHRSGGGWSSSYSLARARAQTALVRLNARFVPSNASGDLLSPRPKDWHSALERLSPGATRGEIFQAAGAPFFDGRIGDASIWEYDAVRGGRYHTMRLEFSGAQLREARWIEDAFLDAHRDE